MCHCLQAHSDSTLAVILMLVSDQALILSGIAGFAFDVCMHVLEWILGQPLMCVFVYAGVCVMCVLVYVGVCVCVCERVYSRLVC